MIVELIQEATAAGARHEVACSAMGFDARPLQRWRVNKVDDDQRAGPKTRPKNALSEQERANVLNIVNSEEYRSKSPKQILPLLADKGVYVASESTIYRILRAEGQVHHREPSRAPQHRHRPAEVTATRPNQVWTWTSRI